VDCSSSRRRAAAAGRMLRDPVGGSVICQQQLLRQLSSSRTCRVAAGCCGGDTADAAAWSAGRLAGGFLHCSDGTALSRPGARDLLGTRRLLRRLLQAQQQGGGLTCRLTGDATGAGRGQAGSVARVVFVFVNRIRHVGCLVG
jgi:hypothetical protein